MGVPDEIGGLFAGEAALLADKVPLRADRMAVAGGYGGLVAGELPVLGGSGSLSADEMPVLGDHAGLFAARVPVVTDDRNLSVKQVRLREENGRPLTKPMSALAEKVGLRVG